MNTNTVPHGLSLPIPHPVPRSAQRPETLPRVSAASVPGANWMERLAAWAERQPVHHRIGSYQRFR